MRAVFIVLIVAAVAAIYAFIRLRSKTAIIHPYVYIEEFVTRAEAIAIADSYVKHDWTPSEANIFHGNDDAGIRVDTPDSNFQASGDDRGWWIAGQRNVALPYKWGGFDTPEEFDRGLREGKCAGDMYSPEKRRLLDDAVSTRAVGIDCSGYISRCWKLPRSYSTRELPQLCEPITDLAQIKPGDIFNTHNGHVRLFARWADPERTRVWVYETSAKVLYHELPLQPMLDQGYTAWRYRGMQD